MISKPVRCLPCYVGLAKVVVLGYSMATPRESLTRKDHSSSTAFIHSFSQSGTCLSQVLNHFAVLDGHHLARQLIHTRDEHASQSFIHMVIYSLCHFFFYLVSQPTVSQSLPIILAPSVLLDPLFSKSINYSHIFHLKQSFYSIIPSTYPGCLYVCQSISHGIILPLSVPCLFGSLGTVTNSLFSRVFIHPSFGQSASVMVNLHCQLD